MGWRYDSCDTPCTSRLSACFSGVASNGSNTTCLTVPKTTRQRVTLFLVIVLLCLFTLVMLCFQSCSTVCYGLCDVSNYSPVLGNFYRSNSSRLRFAHTKRHLPRCLIIGVRKAGTRALLHYLNIHPEVVTAKMEVHFFDRDAEYKQGLEYYRHKMPYSFKHQTTVEKTPAYFTEPLVPERVYRMNSSILLLLIVRDPVKRLISDYTQLRLKLIGKGKQPVPFKAEVLDAEGNIRTGYKAIKTSVYSIYLARWLEFFPLKQIHIVDGDALTENPYKEMYDVETFLGLEHRITQDKFYYNSTKGFFCVNDGDTSECLGQSKGRAHPYVDPALLEKLKRFYARRNQVFFHMVNRIFNWS